MNYLGIDYGRRKIGVSVGDDVSRLAEPFMVIFYKDVDEALIKICDLVSKEDIEKVVIGLSKEEIGEESKIFGKKLEQLTHVSTIFVEEFLSTKMAQKLSIEANIKREKRKRLEDAYSATLILQSYLDENEFT
ncbi:Holliday junction resolvase RuvX [Candidatus Woesebacteria bacterium]|nr:MAG: Holliday junction resolvase RuvX [Candidatus Woesebacteria bacterium]